MIRSMWTIPRERWNDPVPVEDPCNPQGTTNAVMPANAPDLDCTQIAMFMGDDFVCKVWEYPSGMHRLQVYRRLMKPDGSDRFEDGITWDELMEVKRQCGYADQRCYEVYPEDAQIINQQNCRHLWLPFAHTCPDCGARITRVFGFYDEDLAAADRLKKLAADIDADLKALGQPKAEGKEHGN